MSDLLRRLARLEASTSAVVCRQCGAPHTRSLADLIAAAQYDAPNAPICACSPCCSWVADLVARLEDS